MARNSATKKVQAPTAIDTQGLAKRIERLGQHNPRNLPAIERFLDLLETQPAGSTDCPGQGPGGEKKRVGWLPVLGRSAAGVIFFWEDLPEGDTKASARKLSELIEAYLKEQSVQHWPGSVQATSDQDMESGTEAVSLIQIDVPDDAAVAEFLDCPAVRKRYPDAFALRIDGASMAPQFVHGDLVIVSPSAEAVDGKPAVVQLSGQIGATCKIFRREMDKVHLIPSNSEYKASSFALSEVVWALRVLFRVRIAAQPGQ